ncbi:NmrA family NAD(P)-binding protein [Nakamurella sp. DB0629]|uniref:NmrA family NAD(P)-binding protein n=1 Tax=Nakamurella aerolata TaxID=1656892 RepID=A0A849A6Y6_9ACTN|nr:NmrA family NAD(P)-binding protein [Nakamurella aerolata]
MTCPRGKTSRHVVESLTRQRVSIRPVGRSEQVAFDWTDASTWTPALAGARAAYLVYQPDLAMPGAAETVGSLAQLAVRQGLEHLVLLSGRNEPGAQQAEEAVRATGIDTTIVTTSFFTQNFTEGLLQPMAMSGEIVMPAADLPEPFVDTADIGAVVTAALTDPRHRGQRYEVTGPTAPTFAEVGAAIGAATGRTVGFQQVSSAEFVRRMAAIGVPEPDAEGLAWLFEMILDGRNSQPTDGIQRALGRPGRAYTDVIAEAAAAGAYRADGGAA